MNASGAPPEPHLKKRAFISLIFGSPLKIGLFIIWVFLLVSTPFGVRIDFTSGTQPPVVFFALILRNAIFYLAIFSALRPDNYQKIGYVILSLVLAFFTMSFLTMVLEIISIGAYFLSQILIVRQLEPAVNFLARPPLTPPSKPGSRKNILIVVLEFVGYLVVVIIMNQFSAGFDFLETATMRFGYIIMPALLMFFVAVVLFSIIAVKSDVFHAHLQKQFTVIIPLLLGMGVYLAYRFWIFAQTYQSFESLAPEVTYGIFETINAFLLVALTVWTFYDKAGGIGQNRRRFTYILWIYTLTLYNIWFEPMLDAQGLFMMVLLLSGVGVYFMVRALAKDYARRIGLPRDMKFRQLLFREQKAVISPSLVDLKWGDGGQ